MKNSTLIPENWRCITKVPQKYISGSQQKTIVTERKNSTKINNAAGISKRMAKPVAENKKYTKIEEPRYECQMASHKKNKSAGKIARF